MKHYSPSAYAKILLSFAEHARGQREEQTIKAFIALLKNNRDWRKRHEVVKALEGLVRIREGRHLLTIQSARPLTKAQRANITAEFPDAKYDYEEEILSSLVGGVRLTIDRHTSVDGSLTHILTRLFA
jgi:F0F1-type ATP synthase delta subunit